MSDPRKDECGRKRGKNPAIAARQFQTAKQDQEEGRILDKVGLCAHAPQHRFIAAVADLDRIVSAAFHNSRTEPDIDGKCSGGGGKRDRNGRHAPHSHSLAALATAASGAIGTSVAMIRPPPRGFPVEKAQIVAIFIFAKQVPQWLSPKEKHRPPSATCAAATMR
jgi:hypothetical protein